MHRPLRNEAVRHSTCAWLMLNFCCFTYQMALFPLHRTNYHAILIVSTSECARQSLDSIHNKSLSTLCRWSAATRIHVEQTNEMSTVICRYSVPVMSDCVCMSASMPEPFILTVQFSVSFRLDRAVSFENRLYRFFYYGHAQIELDGLHQNGTSSSKTNRMHYSSVNTQSKCSAFQEINNDNHGLHFWLYF